MKIDRQLLEKAVERVLPVTMLTTQLFNAYRDPDTVASLNEFITGLCTAVANCVQDQVDAVEVSNCYGDTVDEEFWKACVLAGLQNSAVDQAIDDADRALATLIDRRKPIGEQA